MDRRRSCMRYLLFILILSSSVTAKKPFNIDMIDEVRSLYHNELMGEIEVTFWASNKIYRMDESHSVVSCLEEAYKSQTQVALNFDHNNQIILDCELVKDLGK